MIVQSDEIALLTTPHGPIRRLATRFALAGYVVAYDPAGTERGNALKTTKELESYDADAWAVLALRAAMNLGVRAAACFYPTDIHKRSLGKGMNDNSLDRIPEIEGEVVLISGRQDPHVPTEGRPAGHGRGPGAIPPASGFWRSANDV